MLKKEFTIIGVALNSPEELFAEPVFDPYDPESRFDSGIDELVHQLKKLSPKRELQIEISLPSLAKDADAENQMSKAIRRYCSVKILDCQRTIQETKRQAIREIMISGVIALALLICGYILTFWTSLPQIMTYIFSSGIGILTWVILWPPLDSYLYEWRPCRQTQLVYERIQAAMIVLNAIDSVK